MTEHGSSASEDASATYTLSTDATWNQYEWDAAKNQMASTPKTPVGGKLAVALTGTPIFLVQP